MPTVPCPGARAGRPPAAPRTPTPGRAGRPAAGRATYPDPGSRTTSRVTVSPGSAVSVLTRSGEITFRYLTANPAAVADGSAGRGAATIVSAPSTSAGWRRTRPFGIGVLIPWREALQDTYSDCCLLGGGSRSEEN